MTEEKIYENLNKLAKNLSDLQLNVLRLANSVARQKIILMDLAEKVGLSEETAISVEKLETELKKLEGLNGKKSARICNNNVKNGIKKKKD